MVFSMQLASGQKNHIEKELRSLKAFQDTLQKRTCRTDTLKRAFCKEKTNQYLIYKKKFLLKIDSVDKVIHDLNERGEKYYYYLYFGKATYFDWGNCNIEVLNDSTTLEFAGAKDSWDNYIDCKIKVEKIEKFNFDLSDFTSGQTFYREDIKRSPLRTE